MLTDNECVLLTQRSQKRSPTQYRCAEFPFFGGVLKFGRLVYFLKYASSFLIASFFCRSDGMTSRGLIYTNCSFLVIPNMSRVVRLSVIMSPGARGERLVGFPFKRVPRINGKMATTEDRTLWVVSQIADIGHVIK